MDQSIATRGTPRKPTLLQDISFAQLLSQAADWSIDDVERLKGIIADRNLDVTKLRIDLRTMPEHGMDFCHEIATRVSLALQGVL